MVNTPQLAYDPIDAAITVGTEAANAINVAIQLKDSKGNDCPSRRTILAYLSDDAYGDSIVATEPNTSVLIGTDGLLIPLLTGAAGAELNMSVFMLVSEVDGDIDITITNTTADTFYLILVMPDGRLLASGAITFT